MGWSRVSNKALRLKGSLLAVLLSADSTRGPVIATTLKSRDSPTVPSQFSLHLIVSSLLAPSLLWINPAVARGLWCSVWLCLCVMYTPAAEMESTPLHSMLAWEFPKWNYSRRVLHHPNPANIHYRACYEWAGETQVWGLVKKKWKILREGDSTDHQEEHIGLPWKESMLITKGVLN